MARVSSFVYTVKLIQVKTWFQVQFGDKYAWVNFSKTTKLHGLVRQVQFIVCEKFTSAYYTKLQEKSWYEKTSQKVKADKILNACMCHM